MIHTISCSPRVFRGGLGQVRRRDSERGRFTLIFLETGRQNDPAQIELTYNWDQEAQYSCGRIGHLAFGVDDIYAVCQHLQERGHHRTSSDGRMAFVRSPDQISVALTER